ncbi:hypothetical protein EMCRGX_G000074 [Ephydatia muelleri]
MVNSFREDQLCFQDEAEQPDAVVDHDFNLPVHHPFGAYFSRKTDKVVLIDGGSTVNKYYKPEYFDALMKNWFPMAPFWSGLMLGDLQRHKQEASHGKQTSESKKGSRQFCEKWSKRKVNNDAINNSIGYFQQKPPKPFSHKNQISHKAASTTLRTAANEEIGAIIEVARKQNKGLENSSNICWLNAAIQALFTTPLYTMMKAMMSLSKASLLEAFVSICNDLEGMVNHPCDPANLAHVGQAIIKESSTEHQAAHVENENSDDSVLDQSIRKDHDMSDGYEDDGNIDDCDDKSDEDEEEERDPNFLVPTYINQPDPDDLCALKWGKDHYMRYLPSMKRKPYTNVRQTSSDALVVQDHQNIAYLGQIVGNVRQTSSDALVVQDHQNIAYLGQTVGNVRRLIRALVVQDHQTSLSQWVLTLTCVTWPWFSGGGPFEHMFRNVRQTSSDALVVQDHQNIAYLGQTVGNVRQTSSDALVVQDHQNIAYLGQTVGNVRQTSSDALVVQDHQNIAYFGQTVGNVRQTSSDALVVQDHQNIAYLGQTVGNVRQTSSDALVVQDHQIIAYLGQTVG